LTGAMVKLSANLGFLWSELPLPEAIAAAANAGFDAVESHFPFDVDPSVTNQALGEAGIPMLGLNTRPGDTKAGEAGLAAVPGREAEVRDYITEAVNYAAEVGCHHVHVMAGRAAGPEAQRTFTSNLAFAAELAVKARSDLRIVIEPINQRDVPGYFLSEVEAAAHIIGQVGADNVTIMFDCYHVQVGQGDVLRRFEAQVPLIGHVQFAAVPSRAEPGDGELNYPWLLKQFVEAGYVGYMGAEYRPQSAIEAGLSWMDEVWRG